MALLQQKTFQQMYDEVSEIVLRVSEATASTSPNLARIKQFVNDAQIDICSEYDWYWLFNVLTLNTVIGQQTPYNLDTTVEELKSMAIPANQVRLGGAAWLDWIRVYPGRYINVGNTRPWMFVEAASASDNSKQYYLFPAADAVYNVEYAFRKRVPAMVNTGDYPIIPTEWQDVLIARAIYKAFRFLGDDRMKLWDHNDLETDAGKRYERMWMENENKPTLVNRWRDLEYEYAYTAFLDVNRMLFVGG